MTAPCPTVSPTVMLPAPELTPSVPTLNVAPEPMASVCASVYPFTYIAASVLVASLATVSPSVARSVQVTADASPSFAWHDTVPTPFDATTRQYFSTVGLYALGIVWDETPGLRTSSSIHGPSAESAE